jgi:uncharacterized lipoprotein YehR (DUF1307 family)
MSKAMRKQRSETVVSHKDLKAKTEKVEVETTKLTKEQTKALEGFKTVSEKIRFLNKEGITNSNISRLLNKRYQHVRNVLETPLKRKKA